MSRKFRDAVKEYGVGRLATVVGCNYETVRRWTIDTRPDINLHGKKVAATLGMTLEEIYGESPRKKTAQAM